MSCCGARASAPAAARGATAPRASRTGWPRCWAGARAAWTPSSTPTGVTSPAPTASAREPALPAGPHGRRRVAGGGRAAEDVRTVVLFAGGHGALGLGAGRLGLAGNFLVRNRARFAGQG